MLCKYSIPTRGKSTHQVRSLKGRHDSRVNEIHVSSNSYLDIDEILQADEFKAAICCLFQFRYCEVVSHAEAEAGLGYLYSVGIGTEKDDAQAVGWFRKGAEKGSLKGQFNLGRMIANGRGTAKDLKEGFRWMQQAADQGLPEAVYAVGDAFYFGKFGQKRDGP